MRFLRRRRLDQSAPDAHRAAVDSYLQLRDEKAADWRFITQINVSMLALWGVATAAGLYTRTAYVLALAPVLVFLGLFQMCQTARLHVRMNAYLASNTPDGVLNWEGASSEKRTEMRREESKRERLLRTSAWYQWLSIFVVVDVGSLVCLATTGWLHMIWALVVGGAVGLTCLVVSLQLIRSMEREARESKSLWPKKEQS